MVEKTSVMGANAALMASSMAANHSTSSATVVMGTACKISIR